MLFFLRRCIISDSVRRSGISPPIATAFVICCTKSHRCVTSILYISPGIPSVPFSLLFWRFFIAFCISVRSYGLVTHVSICGCCLNSIDNGEFPRIIVSCSGTVFFSCSHVCFPMFCQFPSAI